MILQGFMLRCAGCQARRLSTSQTRRLFTSYCTSGQARKIMQIDSCMFIKQHKYHRHVVILKEKNIFEEFDDKDNTVDRKTQTARDKKFNKVIKDSENLRKKFDSGKVTVMALVIGIVTYIMIYTFTEEVVIDDQPKVASEWMTKISTY
ncbi:hypothetical protein ACF0H5_016556 [Mactra antiquata]